MISFLLAEPWCLGAPVPIRMPDDRDGNAASVFVYLRGYGLAAKHNLGVYAAYQPCKTRGIHCCSLLGLLLEIDYLEVSNRKSVEMEITSYSQVLFLSTWSEVIDMVHFRLYVSQAAR